MNLWLFIIISDWTFSDGHYNVELLSVHYERNYNFWITILGITFIWENNK